MSTLRTVIRGLRKVIALPLWLISGIAFLVLGFQLLLALANVLRGVSIVDALLLWVTNTIVLTIVAFVAGGLALLISGPPSDAVTALNEGALKSDEAPPPMRMLAANGSRDGGEPGAPAERLEDGRLLFGPNAGEVLRVVDGLQRAEPNVWLSLADAHITAHRDTARAARVTLLVEQGARSGISCGAITAEDVSAAKTIAAAAAARVIPLVIAEARSKFTARPEDLDLAIADYLQTAAVSLVVFVVVRPFLEADEFEELWAPYAAVAPLSPSPGRRRVRDMDAERHAWVVAHTTQPAVPLPPVRVEYLVTWLRENREASTVAALRDRLLVSGHLSADVDAAMSQLRDLDVAGFVRSVAFEAPLPFRAVGDTSGARARAPDGGAAPTGNAVTTILPSREEGTVAGASAPAEPIAFCLRCGRPRVAGTRFCGGCGMDLGAAPE